MRNYQSDRFGRQNSQTPSLDDGIIGGGLITYGVFLFFQAAKNKKRVATIIQLMGEHNEETALQLLLEQQGISITRNSNN